MNDTSHNERPESQTGEQPFKERKKRGKSRTPTWEQVRAWRSRWDYEAVQRICLALSGGSEKPESLVEKCKTCLIDGDGRKVVDLRGLDVSLLYPYELEQVNAAHSVDRTSLDNVCFDGAILTDLDLSNADLARVSFKKATLRRTNLSHSNLEKAFLDDADFRDAIVDDTNFSFVRYTEDGWCNRGTIFREVDLSRALHVDPLLEKYARDQYFLYVKKYRSGPITKLLFNIWWLTSDYGRNLFLWAMWCAVAIVAFAFIYTPPPSWFGEHAHNFSERYGPVLVFDPNLQVTFWNYLYFSLLTFIAPSISTIQPGNWQATFLMITEIICATLMLAVLVSILVNKVARRS